MKTDMRGHMFSIFDSTSVNSSCISRFTKHAHFVRTTCNELKEVDFILVF